MGDSNDNPSEIASIHLLKVLPVKMVDLTKKRKLQDEQVVLPLSKYMFGDRTRGSDIETETAEMEEVKETLYPFETDAKTDSKCNGLEQSESAVDGNSITGESDTAMSYDADSKHRSETRFMKMYHHDQLATSSGDYNDFKHAPYSLSGISATVKCKEQPTTSGKTANRSNLEGGQFVPGTPSVEDQLTGYGISYADYPYSEFEITADKEPSDVAAHEMMLYSNEAPSNFYMLSSSRLDVNNEARLGTRKPTIDQEFEQYFSTLML